MEKSKKSNITFMTNEQITDEILFEAHTLKIQEQVLDFAKKLLELNPKMERVDALQAALNHYKNNS